MSFNSGVLTSPLDHIWGAGPIPATTKIDRLNAELARAGVYDKLVQKRITMLADIRNSADHGHFDKCARSDVENMVKWTRRFAADYLQ